MHPPFLMLETSVATRATHTKFEEPHIYHVVWVSKRNVEVHAARYGYAPVFGRSDGVFTRHTLGGP